MQPMPIEWSAAEAPPSTLREWTAEPVETPPPPAIALVEPPSAPGPAVVAPVPPPPAPEPPVPTFAPSVENVAPPAPPAPLAPEEFVSAPPVPTADTWVAPAAAVTAAAVVDQPAVASPPIPPPSDEAAFAPVAGSPPAPGGPGYGWPVMVAEDQSNRRRAVGVGVILLGVALLAWGVGAAFIAGQAYQTQTQQLFGHWERLGYLIQSIGICLAGLITIYIGAAYRKL